MGVLQQSSVATPKHANTTTMTTTKKKNPQSPKRKATYLHTTPHRFTSRGNKLLGNTQKLDPRSTYPPQVQTLGHNAMGNTTLH